MSWAVQSWPGWRQQTFLAIHIELDEYLSNWNYLCNFNLFCSPIWGARFEVNETVEAWNKTTLHIIIDIFNIFFFPLSAEYSMLLVNFHLQRHMGNFLIQVYGPCVLLVVLSWVSFWLNREATADRVSLGITTVLTMTFLGLEARTDLPKVPYPTALDFFVFLSFAFIFATIIQVFCH